MAVSPLSTSSLNSQPSSTYAETAESLFEQGFWPLPLESANPKKPAVCFKEFSRKGLTLKQIHKWIKKFPQSNVCALVRPEQVCADFDADRPDGLILPVSPVAITRRGEHRWYAISQPARTRKMIIGGHVYGDVKGAGSIVVLPPSQIRNHTYEWQEYLSPEETGFQEAPGWLRQEENTGKKGKYINILALQTDAFPVTPCAMGDFASPEGVAAFLRQPAVLARVFSFLGIPLAAIGGGSFLCVLPGHRECHPSASVLCNDSRRWPMYRDWHRRNGQEWYALADVYASQKRGRTFCITDDDDVSGVARLLWTIRLLLESGAIRWPLPALALPSDAPPAAQMVASGMSMLYACRWSLRPGEPAPFSWRFGRIWCGATDATIQEGMKYLLENNVIESVGKITMCGRETSMFLPVL